MKELRGKAMELFRENSFQAEGPSAVALWWEYAWSICDTARRTGVEHLKGAVSQIYKTCSFKIFPPKVR